MGKSFLYALAVLCGVAGVLDSPAVAQETFRWQFEAGQAFDVQFTCKTQSVTDYLGTEITVSQETTYYLAWEVRSVDENGTAQIEQVLDRAVIDLIAQGQLDFHIDTDEDIERESLSDPLAGVIVPLVGIPIDLEISNRGEVLAMELTEEARAIFVDDPGDVTLLSGTLGLNLAQGYFLLPIERISAGQSWEHDAPFATQPFPQVSHSHSTYVGSEQYDGKAVARFNLEGEISVVEPEEGEEQPESPITMQLENSATQGTMWFDNDAGYLMESEFSHASDVVLEYARRKTVSDSEMNLVLKITPVEGE